MGCVTKGLWTLEMTCHRPSGPSALLASPGQTFLQNFLRCPPTISGPLSPFITPLPPLHTLQGPVRCRPWAKSGWRSTSQDQAHPSLWVPEAVCPPLLPSPSPPSAPQWKCPLSLGTPLPPKASPQGGWFSQVTGGRGVCAVPSTVLHASSPSHVPPSCLSAQSCSHHVPQPGLQQLKGLSHGSGGQVGDGGAGRLAASEAALSPVGSPSVSPPELLLL